MLPKEILCRILTLLSNKERVRAERVCRLWRWLGTGEEEYNLWRGEHKLIVDFRSISLPACLAIAIRIGPWLHHLELEDFLGSMTFRNFYRELTTHTPNLQCLSIIYGLIEEDGLLAIGEYTPNLIGLSIDLTYQYVRRFSRVIRSTENVLHVEPLNRLLQACSKLRSLKLNIRGTNGGELTALPAGLTKLSFCIWDARVLKQFLARATMDCTQLRMLAIETEINDFSSELIELKRKNPSLEYMKLRISDEDDIERLIGAGFFQNLKCLELRCLDGEQLHLISKQCPQLEFFRFEYFKAIRMEQFAALKKLRRLRHLHFNLFLIDHDGCYREFDDKEHEEFGAILAEIVANANGTLEHFFVNVSSSVDYLVNSLLRPCKSLRAISCTDEALQPDMLYAAINALAIEEGKEQQQLQGDGGNPIKREWPIHVNLGDCYDSTTLSHLNASPFVRWEWTTKNALTRKILRTILRCNLMDWHR